MKKLFTTIFVLLAAYNAFSQANFHKFGIGVTGGLTTAYTGFSYTGDKSAPNSDAKKSIEINKSRIFGGSVDYYITPFIAAGVEYNIVQLKDGPDQHNKQFVSDFSSIEIRGNVSAGQFFDYNYNPLLHALRTFNVSLGVGIINGTNNVQEWDSGLLPRRRHIDDLGQKNFTNVISFPATIGYNFNIRNSYDEVFLQLGINYKTVFTSSDDLDGYNYDPAKVANKAKDIYTTLGVSLKCMLGPRRIYFK